MNALILDLVIFTFNKLKRNDFTVENFNQFENISESEKIKRKEEKKIKKNVNVQVVSIKEKLKKKCEFNMKKCFLKF